MDTPEHLSRKDFLKVGAGGIVGVIMAGTNPVMAMRKIAAQKRAKACILLWMGGGPSQLDTFDPKPDTMNGGMFKAIRTAAKGIRISEHLPKVAEQMRELAIIRSMTSREGNHDRASYLLHTGYTPQATVQYASLGAMISFEMGDLNAELPSFISINGSSAGPGFLGPRYRPLVIGNAGQMPGNIKPYGINEIRQYKRWRLLDRFEDSFDKRRDSSAIVAHRDVYEKAQRLMESKLTKVFDVSNAGSKQVRRYKLDNYFGRGCLVAKRLIEVGVPFVEVQLGGWDTHSDVFNSVSGLSSQLDPAFAALVEELRADGMLDETLVVWMGEFGRTPRINERGGRDHFPGAWSVVMAGGGVSGGQVIGSTSDDGMEVKDNPVQVQDLFASIGQSFGIDPKKELVTPEGRPIAFAKKDAKVIDQLFG
jgi:hypothetical protein